ncbi:putative membrane protein [Candidatus Koribacter versatilis Ellin345]|uniref:Membrane protein n=1 Tax=Koribacter versatilis (strain Ellin345) TaxID=204669 RepID=Q1IRZ5_KORVE|nr:YXWGXW repeat-containing protein [Candidatus Koribacter versatilis]ABF40355.1 putative membrane protein [Candidatus Koribacter versatilis Ellin345]
MQRIRTKYWIALCVLLLAVSGSALAQVAISVSFGPPAIPVYEQPLCPGDGYIWTPGYWAWDADIDDYYWVPGTWVLAPEVGFLWTPPWWGWEAGVFIFHDGYWGPHVGFYGGINYGFGYFGDGYWGGRWQGGRFFYNREVTRVNVTNITNVYNEHVTINNNSHVSYHGGEGGIAARPTREQEEWARERHIAPVGPQREHEHAARQNPQLHAKANQGRPPIAATEKPGDFRGHVIPAKEAGAPYRPEARGTTENKAYVHPKDLPPTEHMPTPNTGDTKLDKKYQQQQDKLYAKQEKDRQKLQQKQDSEHVKLQQQHMPPERQQGVEQKHRQQTQSMAEKHTQQRQQMQSRQAPPPHKR